MDVAFFREEPTGNSVVVDIGKAHDTLKATLQPPESPEPRCAPGIKGRNTTTISLPPYFERMAEAAAKGLLGPGSKALSKIRVVLHETHVAKAWFEGSLGNPEVAFAIPGDLSTPHRRIRV